MKSLYILLVALVTINVIYAQDPLWTAQTFSGQGVRGFNGPSDISDASMQDMAATGANVVRYFVELSPADSADTSYTYNPAGLASIVASAAKYCFKVVIVLDYNFGAYTPQNWGSNSQGVSLRKSIASIWKGIATTYNGNPAVAAYDLYNEPILSFSITQADQNQWISYATVLIDTIRAIDSGHVIIFEPTPGALAPSFSTMTSPLPFNNIVYSFHAYDPYPITFQGVTSNYTVQETYPSPSSADIGLSDSTTLPGQIGIAAVATFQGNFSVPVYVGEFSCVRWAPLAPSNSLPTAYNWVHDVISIWESHGWSWNYHSWREWEGWDSEIPETWFYQFPYTNAAPQWGSQNPADHRSNTSPALMLLKEYFKLNTICSTTATRDLSLKDSFSIYPNPATAQLTIEIPPPAKENALTICSIDGQELIRQTIKDSRTQIAISNLASGIYIVKLITGNSVEIRKIIKK